MNWYRKYPLFAFGLTVCGVVAVGELALAYERYAALRDAEKRLAQRKVELEGMAQLAPPPTREVAAAIEADLAKAQKSLAAMQGELTGKGPALERLGTAKVPASRTDSYFDLATFVERTREVAEKHGVELRPEAARFGFSKYANEGPETDRIAPIFRQRQIAEYLITALLEAKPRAVISIKRERTLTKAEREARAAAEANGETPDETAVDAGSDSPDYFVIDPRVSARVKGYLDTTPFRFVFTGQTATLRAFLSRLASFELPVLVREVEVEPATAEESASAASDNVPAASSETPTSPSVVLTTDAAPKGTASKEAATKTQAPASAARATTTPIVSKSLSKFTVTVEFIDLLPANTAPAEEQPAPSTS
ncbi:MAG: hypothetical protein HZC55_27895 [Verrucomicrobia bacterium]|nr:hypothetical protein [Verrucomicrobiota bacterium]